MNKKKRKALQKMKRMQKIRKDKVVRFSLANSRRKYGGFNNKYCYQTNIHNLIYKDVQFSNVRYHASNITQCNFKNSKLEGVDFICCNLKKTNFKGARFRYVIFFNCNLKDTNFESTQFDNVYFITTNTDNARNLKVSDGCRILKTYPKMTLSRELENTFNALSVDTHFSKYHVLHTKKKKTNLWNISILYSMYGEKIARGLMALFKRKDKRNFYTLYSYKKFFDSYFKI